MHQKQQQPKKPSRKPLVKSQQDEQIHMTQQNLKICNNNQDRYQTPQLNQAFELHYYGFVDIANLEPYFNLNTIYLNNNVIRKIQNLGFLKKLVTLNLANNQIQKIEGLQELEQIFILDLSFNKIEKIEGISNLQKLMTFNISHNLLKTHKSVEQIEKNKKLTCLNLMGNPIEDDKQLYTHLTTLLTLYLKDTPFSRGVASYRKETICHLKALTYLDEKPVTKQERLMAQAWKEGGLQKEKEVRKTIQEGKDQKNRKIFQEMQIRSEKIRKLRDELFQKLSRSEREELENLEQKLKQINQSQFFELQLTKVKIQQIKQYLQLFRKDVDSMNVAQTREVPNNLCERHQADAIYIYGVKQQQLPKIKQTYYPDETRPLIAVDFEQQKQQRWVSNYNQLLHETCHQFLGKSQFILPKFNIKVHQFDQKNNRKARRFKQNENEVTKKIEEYSKIDALQQTEKEHEFENALNDLD